jgi:hypothetical protein
VAVEDDTINFTITDNITTHPNGLFRLTCRLNDSSTFNLIIFDINGNGVSSINGVTPGTITSLYLDGKTVFFNAIGYSPISISYSGYSTHGIADNVFLVVSSLVTNTISYQFDNVRFYPTGKVGPTGPAGAGGDVSSWSTYAASSTLNMNSNDISNVGSLGVQFINGHSIADILNIGRTYTEVYEIDNNATRLYPNSTYYSPVLSYIFPNSPLGFVFSGQMTITISNSVLNNYQLTGPNAILKINVMTGDNADIQLTNSTVPMHLDSPISPIYNSGNGYVFNNYTITTPFFYNGYAMSGTRGAGNPDLYVVIEFTSDSIDDYIDFTPNNILITIDASQCIYNNFIGK